MATTHIHKFFKELFVILLCQEQLVQTKKMLEAMYLSPTPILLFYFVKNQSSAS